MSKILYWLKYFWHCSRSTNLIQIKRSFHIHYRIFCFQSLKRNQRTARPSKKNRSDFFLENDSWLVESVTDNCRPLCWEIEVLFEIKYHLGWFYPFEISDYKIEPMEKIFENLISASSSASRPFRLILLIVFSRNLHIIWSI